MSNHLYYRRRQTPLTHFVHQVVAWELFWPLPLIGLGLLRIEEWALVGPALALALLPWLARWLAWGWPTRPTYMSGALALFVVSAPVGIWASYDPALSWPLLWTLLGSVSLFFALINTEVSPHWLAYGLVGVATLFAFYFIGQYGHFHYQYETGRLAYLGRLTGSILPRLVFFTPHPNAAAGFLESSFLLSLVLAWRARGSEKLIWGGAAALIAYGLLISGSRGAWVGLVVAVSLWVLFLIPQQNLRWLISGVALVVVAAGAYGVTQIVLSSGPLPLLTSTVYTAMSRLTLYRNSLYLLSEYPFTGIGLGDTFGMVYSRYQLLIQSPYLTYSHNLFLSVGLGLGLLGLAALTWLLISFYHFVRRVEKVGLSTQLAPLFRAAWLGTTVTFVHGLTDAPQFAGTGWTMPMLFGILGLTVAVGRLALDEAEAEEAEFSVNSHHRLGWLTGGLVAAVLLVSLLVFWRPLLGGWYGNLGAIQQTRSELSPQLAEPDREAAAEAAVNNFARALSINPVQPAANRRLGLMALDRANYETATVYLDQAYRQEPGNQATLKALGYAYLWTGQLDLAEPLLRQIDDQSELIEELGNWSYWWNSQNKPELAEYAGDMVRRLAAAP